LPIRTFPVSLVLAGMLRTTGNAGLALPIRTFPVSLVLAGMLRTIGNAGLALPTRTFPVSLVLAGMLRTTGNAGLALPIRIRPLSVMMVGLIETPVKRSLCSALAIASSSFLVWQHCSDVTRRTRIARLRQEKQPSARALTIRVIDEIWIWRVCGLRVFPGAPYPQ
jgi:hypothetical protein